MSRNSLRRAALGLLFAVLLGIAAPVPATAWNGEDAGGVFTVIWEWIEGLWPEAPASDPPACTQNCGDAGHGVDPNG